MPFGGVGNSGFGRENGMDFVYEYTEAKSILFGYTKYRNHPAAES